MIDGTRYFVYTVISIWKMMVFTGMAWGLSTYTGLLREPYTLFTNFTTSFKSHAYNVSEINDVIFGGGAGSLDNSLEEHYIGTLFTQEFSPRKPSFH